MIDVVRPKYSWGFLKRACLHCNQPTRERVTHYFYIVQKSGRWKRFPAHGAEHYLCHAQTCIDWRCIKLREDISKTAKDAASEIAKAELEQFNKLAGP